MGKVVELTGQRFGKLVVVERAGSNKNKACWLCKCDCGEEIIIKGDYLRYGNTSSCGCLMKGNRFNVDIKNLIKMYDKNDNHCLVDLEDLDKIKQYTWYYGDGYFRTNINKKTVLLHRFLLDVKSGEIIDHINGDALDNRKCNLRLCNVQQNCWNRCKLEGSISKYKGVTWRKDNQKWRVIIRFNDKNYSLGQFDSEEEAGRRYDEEAKKLFGEFAKLNFVESDGE